MPAFPTKTLIISKYIYIYQPYKIYQRRKHNRHPHPPYKLSHVRMAFLSKTWDDIWHWCRTQKSMSSELYCCYNVREKRLHYTFSFQNFIQIAWYFIIDKCYNWFSLSVCLSVLLSVNHAQAHIFDCWRVVWHQLKCYLLWRHGQGYSMKCQPCTDKSGHFRLLASCSKCP